MPAIQTPIDGATPHDTKAAPPATRDIEPRELHAMLTRGECVVVDVREPDEHAREHIEGSALMPLSKFDPAEAPDSQGRVVVFHCRSGTRSQDATQRVLASGGCQPRYLAGGIQAWRAAGLPVVENTRVPISLMRQVQIAAGSMVVIGTALGAFVSPWWLILSGGVGAGLVFAGVSGTCGLAVVLGYMPWNKLPEGFSSCAGGSCRT